MEIHVGRDGTPLGKFTRDEVLQKLSMGELRSTDLCWWQGRADWSSLGDSLSELQALGQLSAASPSAPAATTSPAAGQSWGATTSPAAGQSWGATSPAAAQSWGAYMQAESQAATPIPVEESPFNPVAWVSTVISVLTKPTETFAGLAPGKPIFPALLFFSTILFLANMVGSALQLAVASADDPLSKIGDQIGAVGFVIMMGLCQTPFTVLLFAFNAYVTNLLLSNFLSKPTDYNRTFRCLALVAGSTGTIGVVLPIIGGCIGFFITFSHSALGLASIHRAQFAPALGAVVCAFVLFLVLYFCMIFGLVMAAAAAIAAAAAANGAP